MAPYFGVSAAKVSVLGGVESMGMIWWLPFLFTRRLLCCWQTGSFSLLIFLPGKLPHQYLISLLIPLKSLTQFL